MEYLIGFPPMAAKPYANYDKWIVNRILSRSRLQVSGCIEYQGNKGHKYGVISITINDKRKLHPAHRAMYIATNQTWDLPGSTQIRHKCDNMRCVNIEHLEPGTAKDNRRDCIERDRFAKVYKKHSRVRVHSPDKILAIRMADGKQAHIAEEFGVSVGYVSKIKLMKAKALIAPDCVPARTKGQHWKYKTRGSDNETIHTQRD